MGAALKIQALRNLKSLIETEVPALAGKVRAGPARRGNKQAYPCLVLAPSPTGFRFVPSPTPSEYDWAADDVIHESATPNIIVWRVGRFDGEIRLYLVTETQEQRYALEQDLLQMFFRGAQSIGAGLTTPKYPDLRRGIVIVDVLGGGTRRDNARCEFRLAETEWRDERVFSDDAAAVLDVEAMIPALVRSPAEVYDISDLRLNLTQDLITAVSDPTDLPDLTELETVTVAADGTITEV